jgi:hypothetical protein
LVRGAATTVPTTATTVNHDIAIDYGYDIAFASSTSTSTFQKSEPDMKTFLLNDMEWDAEAVRRHREQLIEMRDKALSANNFSDAVFLSVTVGLLHHLAEELEQTK